MRDLTLASSGSSFHTHCLGVRPGKGFVSARRKYFSWSGALESLEATAPTEAKT